MRFIIDIKDESIHPLGALSMCMKVIQEGRISNGGKQHCYATRFKNGLIVLSVLNKKSERFIIRSYKT